MHIDLYVALTENSAIEQTVRDKQGKHVIQKGIAALDLGFSLTVNIDFARNIGFLGFPFNYSFSLHVISFRKTVSPPGIFMNAR
jgi:hypothetical protein